MTVSLDGLVLVEVKRELYRNIVSLRETQHLFDDLTNDPVDWQAAQQVEMDSKPLPYKSPQPIIDRPFEEAEFLDAIQHPFEAGNWASSRFSRGNYGVWYGSKEVQTTVHETVFHWRQGLLADSGWEDREGVVIERRIHKVRCDTHLIDLTLMATRWLELRSDNYDFCQELGSVVQEEGHPGLWTPSARCDGTNAVLFTPDPLSDPTVHCYLTYVTRQNDVAVYRSGKRSWMIV